MRSNAEDVAGKEMISPQCVSVDASGQNMFRNSMHHRLASSHHSYLTNFSHTLSRAVP